MPDTTVDGITIHYEVQGDGVPVMLLTGLGGVGRSWGDQVGRFAESFLTIVPDHRGTGGSSAPPDGYAVEALAGDMAGVLRDLDCGPAHIVGSSTGGAMAQVMALDHPDVVRSITLASSWGRADAYFRHQFGVRKQVLAEQGVLAYTEASALVLFSARYFRTNYSDVRAWIDVAAAGTTLPEIMAARIDMIVAHDQLDRLAGIDRPSLVLVGADDTCTPPYYSEELAAAIPGAELRVIDGGHLIYKERPGAFFDTVADFLRRH